MLNYNDKHFDIFKYQEVLNKAEEFIKTKIAKSLTKYGWKDGDPISRSHLFSIILYCDYSSLSSAFSASFRKVNTFETLKGIKKRNQKYANWSKILKETVKHYGQSWGCANGSLSRLIGPFYCGMSNLLKMSQFQIYLLSPTSTSVHLSVATNFSGTHGMILEMDNNKGDCRWLRGMDCSWISRFREEDERYGYIYTYKQKLY